MCIGFNSHFKVGETVGKGGHRKVSRILTWKCDIPKADVGSNEEKNRFIADVI